MSVSLTGYEQKGKPLIIAEWPRNNRETIRVSIDQFNGRDVVDVRSWYTDKSGELKPGRSGICLSVAHLPELADALNKALAAAHESGLFTTEAAA